MDKVNIDIFNDTLSFIKKNKILSESVKVSIANTRFYSHHNYPSIDGASFKDGMVFLSKKRTFQAAMDLHKRYPTKKIGVLNFASATTPGGGVVYGSNAQEESLCRLSTLYPVLNTLTLQNIYYIHNREEQNNIHDDAIIYTPDIVICKTDTIYPVYRLRNEDFVKVDILSCAAPNLGEKPKGKNSEGSKFKMLTDDELYKVLLSRAKHIVHVALANGVDILVLGAFGCGAFKNNPEVVAKAFRKVTDEYAKFFEEIEFAIYDSILEDKNYDTFRRVFNN